MDKSDHLRLFEQIEKSLGKEKAVEMLLIASGQIDRDITDTNNLDNMRLESAKKNHFYGDKTPKYLEMADYFKTVVNYISSSQGDFLYNGKKYVPINSLELKKKIKNLTGPIYKNSHQRVFFDAIRSECCIPKTENPFKSSKNKINMANGVLDIKTGQLERHSPKYNFKYVLPIEYNPDAKTPDVWLRYLDSVFDKNTELIELTHQIFGYTLLGGEPFLHRAFILYGSGRNGKSVWLDTLTNILGKENVSNVPITMLSKPFSAVNLEGKAANINFELTNKAVDSEFFKSAIAGEPLIAAKKGLDEFMLKPKARFLFACNELPVFKDTTTGMLDRLVILPFNNYISEEKRDTTIQYKINAQLSGIFNYALRASQELMIDKQLIKSESVNDMVRQYQLESDSVYEFFNVCVEIDIENGRDYQTKDLHDRYYRSRLLGTTSRVNKKTFERRMSDIIKKYCADNNIDEFLIKKRISQDSARCRGYSGIKLKIEEIPYNLHI